MSPPTFRATHARAAALVAALVAASALAAPSARLRGRADFIAATSADLDGVVLADSTQIPWPGIADVSPDLPQSPDGAADIGKRVWRALSRLERGDLVLAEPALEELFALYADRTGATASRVAAGLLDCRLRRGASAAAVAPWLAFVHASEGTDAADAASGIDARTGLAPALPPIWLPGPSVAALAFWGDSPAAASFDPFSRAGQLAALYVDAARFESGMTVGAAAPSSADEGVRLVAEIVLSRTGEPGIRAERRQALEARLQGDRDAWEQRWVHLALGRSLLREDSEADRMEGVVHLLRVASDATEPTLVPIALAESAVALAQLGHVAEGARLRRELLDRFPLHAAVEWEPIRAWPPKPTAAQVPAPAEDPAQGESRPPIETSSTPKQTPATPAEPPKDPRSP